ncbi:uncharacterized protein LOC114746490 [Neltuma alba]|uniref:uncharacterized protein LOC114732088 n=1 Tax=Neltuma alba TaxID=207710 RepID=UPI0010A536D4|nr:uncharacterized protein LOC114732088 [Prosopis alba]XP_028790535.1 uncharacterized protein LOC114746490 [Prosopis alba]
MLAYAVLHIRSLLQKQLGDIIGILVRTQMDIQFRIRSIISHPFFSRNQRSSSSSSPSHSSSYSPFKSFCSRRDFGESQENGDDNNKGDKFSTDWDKAWSNFRKQGRKSLFSRFSPDKYVSWNPRRSEFPISEETDPIKRTERSNLMLWTSPGFTLVGAIIIVSFLLLYTILAPIK